MIQICHHVNDVSSCYRYVIMAIIICNTVALMIDVYDPPETYANILGYLNIFFTAIFTCEMALKVL